MHTFGHQRYDIRKLCKGKETHQIQQEKRLVKYALRKPPSNSPNPPARQPSFRLTPYMFVFRVNPRPGNRIPHSGILSFSLAVGTDPLLVVFAAATDLARSVDIGQGNELVRGHDHLEYTWCEGSSLGTGTLRDVPRR